MNISDPPINQNENTSSENFKEKIKNINNHTINESENTSLENLKKKIKNVNNTINTKI